MTNCLIFDIGKTHIKWHVLDSEFNTLHVEQSLNSVDSSGPYPHFDVDRIWDQFIEETKKITSTIDVSRICVTTHGATAALIDRTQSGNGLVAPVMDYEYEGVKSLNHAYAQIRPKFNETASPDLPAGLNLGRQLFWLQHSHAKQFAKATDILLYPQYWVWRLTGQLCSEITSLGCHTDLWSPWNNDFSSLVQRCRWDEKFPEIRPAWDCIGTVTREISEATRLPSSCEVFVGVHDSNASYLRHKSTAKQQSFSIVSTGTWSIVMDSQGDKSALDENKDMLANIDVWGNSVICSRFMGGREYANICEKLSGDLSESFTENDIGALVENEVYCLPSWQYNTGPFGKEHPKIENPNGIHIIPSALASLYCALMLDHQLDLVKSSGNVIVSGAFLKNNVLCKLLAQLRDTQTVTATSDDTGTVMGAAQLTDWNKEYTEQPSHIVIPSTIDALDKYKIRWAKKVRQSDTKSKCKIV